MLNEVEEPLRVLVETDGGSGLPITSLVALIGSLAVAVITSTAAIRAANRNAQATLDSQKERHRHEIANGHQVWLRDTKADAYFRMINAAKTLELAAQQICWFSRPKMTESEYEPMYPAGIGEHMRAWDAAASDINAAAASVRAVGDSAIAKYAMKIISATDDAINEVVGASNRATEANPTTFDPDAVAKKELLRVRRLVDGLIDGIRKDLEADKPTSDVTGQ